MRLKTIRLILALVSFLLITFFFIDFAGIFPSEHFHLSKIQLFPALLSGSVLVFCLLLLLTLLLGRVYCSVVCPLGIFQDVVSRVSGWFGRKVKYRFLNAHPWLRFSILGLSIVTFVVGWPIVFALVEPYSAYGRMVTHLLKPVYQAGNNLLASIFNNYGNYTFFHTEVYVESAVSLATAAATLIVTGFLAWKYGRLYCNTICPAGTLLGLASRFSLFRMRIDRDHCNLCSKCERNCKASCIDSRNGEIDPSRCVACFNCISVCKQKAISYRFVFEEGAKAMSLDPESGLSKPVKPKDCPDPKVQDSSVRIVDESGTENENKAPAAASTGGPESPEKRRFLSMLVVTAAATATGSVAKGALDKGLSMATGRTNWVRKTPVSPPGSLGAEHLQMHCTSCHLCISKCPSRVLRPAWMEYGPGGMMQPVLDFNRSFCNYDCTLCSEICPNGAIHKLNKEEKHLCQMGQVVFIEHNCVVYNDETHCGACSEHCPTQAVSMVPYKNGLTIPQVDPSICVGCGACEYVCPAKPFKAIYIEGNPVQLKAKPFEDKGVTDVQIDSFGF